MRQRRARCLRSIISIPAVNLCAPLKAQLWGDDIRWLGQRVSSAGKHSQAGKRTGASVAGAVPWAAPPCRTQRAGQGPPSWPTGKVEVARTVGAIPAAAHRVAEEGARVAGVEASPAVVARHTLVAEVVEAVAARDTLVAVAAVAAVVVEPVADTTNLPSHCTDLSK